MGLLHLFNKFTALEYDKDLFRDAEEGYAYAQWELAKRYAADNYEEAHLVRNMDEAVKWAKRAARQGHKEAQRWLEQKYSDLVDWS